MSKKGENIYKRKDGRWEGRYKLSEDNSGKIKYGYVYGKRYIDVKNKLIEEKALKKQEGRYISRRDIKYGILLDEWLKSISIRVKESTYARYSHLIKTHIRPHLGEYDISDINSGVIDKFIRDKISAGRVDKTGGLSVKTAADILTLVKSTIDFAKNNDFNINCTLYKLTLKKKEKDIHTLTRSEQSLLMQHLMHETDLCKFGIMLALHTGIRIGELCALKWENIDINASVLKVRYTMQRIQETSPGYSRKTKVVITQPKSSSSVRNIPLSSFIMDYMRKFAGQPSHFILTGNKDKFIEPRTMQNRFKKYIDDCGIENINFHALRHTLHLYLAW